MQRRSILLILCLAIATPARAQTPDAGEQAYQEGRKAYDLREWDKAIERFKEAYRLRSDAASLFNIAQSYRLKGDCVEAVGFYKTYKRNFSTAPNIDAVDKFIVELEPCAKERAAKAPKPTPAEAKPLEPPTPARAVYEDRGKAKRRAGIMVGGGGLLIVGTGFVFGALAKSKADEVTRMANPDDPPEFDGELNTKGERYDLIAKISWGLGGAAVIGGVVLYVMGNSAKETRVSVTPTNGGAGFAVNGRF
jgi:hypothetical protein